MTDTHVHELSRQLQEERSQLHPLEAAGNKNTVREILSRTIQFLRWYQMTFMLHLRTPLIGEQNVSPQITIKRIKNDRTLTKRSYSQDVRHFKTFAKIPASPEVVAE